MRTFSLPRLSATLLAVGTLTACVESPTTPLEPAAMIVPAAALEFDYIKFETGMNTLHWLGRTVGDIVSSIATEVVDARASGPVLHIRTVWTFTGDDFFVAELDGTLDTRTGKLLLNGEVTSGSWLGARVHATGWLIGTDSSGGTVFEGSAKLMPGPAHRD